MEIRDGFSVGNKNDEDWMVNFEEIDGVWWWWLTAKRGEGGEDCDLKEREWSG